MCSTPITLPLNCKHFGFFYFSSARARSRGVSGRQAGPSEPEPNCSDSRSVGLEAPRLQGPARRRLRIADYYYERRMYIADAERASYLVKNYPQAPSAQKALVILYHANKAMGLKRAAEEALAVYQTTYHSQPPDSIVA